MKKEYLYTEEEDCNLLEKLKLGDKIAFKTIFKRYWSGLYIYAFNVLHEREICEDIIQEIFVDLWGRRVDNRIENLKAFLYQAIKHQIFNQFRRSKHRVQLIQDLDSVIDEHIIETMYEKEELTKHIENAISELPEQRKIIFRMSRYDGLSNQEISESLDVSIQTVKNQISASLKFIRKSLSKIYLF